MALTSSCAKLFEWVATGTLSLLSPETVMHAELWDLARFTAPLAIRDVLENSGSSLTARERAILAAIEKNIPEEIRSEDRFEVLDSQTHTQGFYSQNCPTIRAAMTGSEAGAKTFFNRQELTRMTPAERLRLMVHEWGHHVEKDFPEVKQDHDLLDRIGLEAARVLRSRTQAQSIAGVSIESRRFKHQNPILPDEAVLRDDFQTLSLSSLIRDVSPLEGREGNTHQTEYYRLNQWQLEKDFTPLIAQKDPHDPRLETIVIKTEIYEEWEGLEPGTPPPYSGGYFRGARTRTVFGNYPANPWQKWHSVTSGDYFYRRLDVYVQFQVRTLADGRKEILPESLRASTRNRKNYPYEAYAIEDPRSTFESIGGDGLTKEWTMRGRVRDLRGWGFFLANAYYYREGDPHHVYLFDEVQIRDGEFTAKKTFRPGDPAGQYTFYGMQVLFKGPGEIIQPSLLDSVEFSNPRGEAPTAKPGHPNSLRFRVEFPERLRMHPLFYDSYALREVKITCLTPDAPLYAEPGLGALLAAAGNPLPDQKILSEKVDARGVRQVEIEVAHPYPQIDFIPFGKELGWNLIFKRPEELRPEEKP